MYYVAKFTHMKSGIGYKNADFVEYLSFGLSVMVIIRSAFMIACF